MKKWLPAIMICVSIYVIFLGEFFIIGRGSVFSFIRDRFFSGFEIDYLRSQNYNLKIELLNLKTGNVLEDDYNGIRAKVFSIYPFSDRSKITLNAGKEDGVKTGKTVIVGNKLVGRIQEVNQKTSIVQTIFDDGFKIPVRIGEGEKDALYTGGINPRLTMIDPDIFLKQGEIIISAHPDFPYGLGLGKIFHIYEGLLKEASVNPFLNIQNVRDVVIIN